MVYPLYSTDGKYLQLVGGKRKNKWFEAPTGLDVYTKMNRIYIAEFGNDRIHCLNLDLSFHSILMTHIER